MKRCECLFSSHKAMIVKKLKYHSTSAPSILHWRRRKARMSIEFRFEQFEVEDKDDIIERFDLYTQRLGFYFGHHEIVDETKKINASVNRLHGKRQDSQNGNQRGTQGKDCGYCGRIHERGTCPARGRKCNKCGGMNHFAVVCNSKERGAKRIEIEK